MKVVHGVRARLGSCLKLMLAAMVVLGVTTAGVVVATTPAFAAGAPTLANGNGAFDSQPTTTLTGCTGTTSSAILTCTSTAGVNIGAGAYGVTLNSANSNSVIGVTPSTITLSEDPAATVTAASVLTFSGQTGISAITGTTTSTTITTSTAYFTDYGINPGMLVYGTGIPANTTIVSLNDSSAVLSNEPTQALSGATLLFAAPDEFDALTLVSGGSANVNTASLTVVSQPPVADGTVVTGTVSSTHGILILRPTVEPPDPTFSFQYAYCAPGDTYSPGSPNCTTATMTYTVGVASDMGDPVTVEGVTSDLYEMAESAHVEPATATKGSVVTTITAPVGATIPSDEYNSTLGHVPVEYADGFSSISPVPAGFTYVPGSIKVTGGDTTSEGVATAKYCTAAGTGCDAQINTGNYMTVYPYIELELPSATEVTGGSLLSLPTVTAQFTATGAPGTVATQTLSEFKVTTEVKVLGILSVAAAFDGYPTTGANPNVTPPYNPPNVLGSTTILPSVTGVSTPNGTDSGPTSGGATVTVTGTGFTGASQVFFGSNPATSFVVNTDNSITAIDPGTANGLGPVDITVVSGGQTSPISEPADVYNYAAPTAPDAPTNVVATPDNGQAEIYWTGGFNEGSPTQNYTVTATDVTNPGTDGDQTTCQSLVPPEVDTCTIGGLTNGDSYTFTVNATNGIGTSANSSPSAAIIVGTPQAPTAVSATGAQNGSSAVTWTDPSNTGASPIIDDTVTASPGGAQCTYGETAGPPTGCTVSGLTNGTSYTFTVSATNSVGTGPSSAPSTAIVPSTVPGAPTIGTATSNANASSVVTFTAPASNGGAAISGYTVTATDTTNPSNPNVTQSGTTSPITVTGLTNGDTYSFSVTATNVSGTGPSSGSVTATPSTVPGAPTNVTAVVGPPVASGSAAVSWSAPASNGGAGITTYTVTSSAGSKTCTTTSTLPATPATTCTVTGLSNGTNTTFTVTAKNASGTSAASVAGPVGGVVPSAVPATPSAPTVTTAGLAAGTASISWTAPTNNGSTLSQYTLTPTPACPSCTGLTVTGAPPTTSTTVGGLTDGTSYTFTLIATNGDGNSTASSASTAAVVGIPAAPTAVTGVPTSTSGQTSVSWTAGASLSGTITSYTLTPTPACSACTGLTVTGSPPATSTTVGGLTNGTSYTFTVKEANASGTSAASSASTGVVTGSPTAPTGVVAVGGTPAPSGDLNVLWVAPSSSGVGTINSYTATAKPSSGTSKTCTSTSVAPATPTLGCQVTGATNGTSYTVTVTATNSAGTAYVSVASAASAAAFPSTTFGAPTIGTAAAGNRSATVSWTAPAALTGTQPALTGYTVTPFIGTTAQTPQTFNSTLTTETVTGLTPLTAYTFTVAAINANGTGTASAKSVAVTPNGPPNAPTGASATAGNGSATVTWTDGSNDGSTTLSYTVTATDTSASPRDPQNGNETCTYTVPAPPATENDSCTVTGLANGDSYTFAVTGTNADGTGPASNPSNSITPSTVPDAPTAVSATAGNQSATVTWTDGFNEGSPTLSYTVTATDTSASPRDPQDGNETCTYTVPAPPAVENDSCQVTGLANADTYTFAVTATNANGTGAASNPSNTITPSTVPDAPTGAGATAGDSVATVGWTAPFNEGAGITTYTVTSSPGGHTCTSTSVLPASPATICQVSGLTNGTPYTFTVTATNADGTGGASGPSNSANPSTVPDAPTVVTATAGNQSASVSWTAPNDEGRTILSYTVTATDVTHAFNGGQKVTGLANPATVTGLTDGDSYTFTVVATNTDGSGAASQPSNSVTPTTLVDVAITSAASTAVAAGKQVNFNVTATGSPRSTITASGAPTWVKLKMGATAGDSVTYKMSGKAPDTSGGTYTFTLEASNGVAPPVYQTFTISVLRVTSPTTASVVQGAEATVDVTTTDTPANPVLQVTKLPTGLSFHDNGNGTGVISGIPTGRVGSKDNAKVTATSGSTVATQTLKITVTS